MNLPQEFITRTKAIIGNEWNAFEQALQLPSPTSIRVNSSKIITNHNLERVPWCSDAYYLHERPPFTFDPLFHAGTYYVQEASSMFLEQGIKQFIKEDVVGLDLCAAPGGKSTLLMSLLGSQSFLIANEYVKSRAYILSENLAKWGNPNHLVCNNNSKEIGQLKHLFDFILIDAPCSGEGMFRKDPQAIQEWSIDNIINCQQRQKDILNNIWGSLKPGGFLFYSTCTYNLEENEQIVKYISRLGAIVRKLEIDTSWGLSVSQIESGEGYHFYPHKTKGEGFFFAVLQKEDDKDISSLKQGTLKSKNNKNEENMLRNYLKDNQQFFFSEKDGYHYGIPSFFSEKFEFLKKHLNILSGGVNIGIMKRKSFIPSQSLALSNFLKKDEFPIFNLTYEEAISYLRCETLFLGDMPRGIVLLQYKQVSLGFVKNVGNRANNLYPSEWRIRSNNSPKPFSLF